MQITYNRSTLTLEDIPLDVGYACEKVSLKNHAGETFSVGGQNGQTQLIIAAPFVDENLIAQLKEIDTLLTLNGLIISKSLIVASQKHTHPHLDAWLCGIDYDTQFGDFYGLRIASGEFGGEFAKALLVVSKDGALFYDEIPKDLNAPFSLENALPKIAAANNCYTGHGCHG